MKKELLRLEHVVQKYEGRKVLNDFKLNLFCGEIVNLVGIRDYENDCLMDLFSGKIRLMEGNSFLEEKTIDLMKKTIPAVMKVICIQKKNTLISQMTVGENLFVIKSNGHKLFLNHHALRHQTHYLLEKAGISLQGSELVSDLRPAQCHFIEILRAQIQNARLIVLEDITGTYSDVEKSHLSQILKAAAKENVAILYLSFYPNEISQIADRTILVHRGQHIRTYYKGEIENEKLTELVQKLNYGGNTPVLEHSTGRVIFEIKHLKTESMAEPFSYALREGEIAGLYDNGQKICDEIMKTIFEKRNWKSGNLLLDGKIVKPFQNVNQLVNSGIIFLPDAIKKNIYMDNFSEQENVFFPILKKNSRFFFQKNKRMQKYVWNAFQDLLMTYFPDETINGKYLEMSISYYRYIIMNPYLIVCINPYRYADSLMCRIIAFFIKYAASKGIAVLIISGEYKEMLQVCDQIVELK